MTRRLSCPKQSPARPHIASLGWLHSPLVIGLKNCVTTLLATRILSQTQTAVILLPLYETRNYHLEPHRLTHG